MHIDEYFIKYIKGEANKAERDKVEDWIASSTTSKERFFYLKAQYVAQKIPVDDEVDQAYVENKLRQFKWSHQSKVITQILQYSKYAAAVGVVMLLSIYWFQNYHTKGVKIIPDDAVTLVLEDGSVIVIDSATVDKQIKYGNVNISSQNLAYNISQSNKEEQKKNEDIRYNTLKVPQGKHFSLTLSDGTKVTLNSGASLKYPVQFASQGNRVVELTGEAYFDVTKNKLKPFEVSLPNSVNIRVLGTKFNVSAYEKNESIETVLVEGAVNLYKGRDYNSAVKTELTPGHKADWNKQDDHVSISKVDVRLYIAWLDGSILFKHEKLKTILQRLEEEYNVHIMIDDSLRLNEYFTAGFNKNQNIEEVLNVFKDYYGVEFIVSSNKQTSENVNN